MVDPRVLKMRNSTTARLKEIFTAVLPENFASLPEPDKEKRQKDVDLREKLEERIQQRLWSAIQINLKNYQIFSAVDLAWDSTPINKAAYPLQLYAQGKLRLQDCAKELNDSVMSKYVERDDKGTPVNINIPKFYETQVNLIRSILTRRLAAQSNKYANLWPYYDYQSRSTSQVGKLRADVMSQRADIIADQYDYRHHEVQVMRDMLMYTNSVDFIASAWDKQKQEFIDEAPTGLETDNPDTKIAVVKEGLCWVNPHPTRVFWDNNYPLPSINTDTGSEWIGYWDVRRYRDLLLNLDYWNRDKISYSTVAGGIFTTYSQYFSQYYTTITPPKVEDTDLTSGNDRKNNIGTYSGDMGDASIVVAEFFWKIIPKEWGIGDYMWPVWTRFIVASDRTVQYAEFLPSTPAAVASYNANDNRQVNISFAHEMMGFQDQLTNLLSYLVLCLQADNIKVLVVDTDVASPEQIKAFRQQVKGQSAYSETTVLEVSRSKLAELGISKADEIVTLVETRGSQLGVIFQAIQQLIQMVERLAALSPQEQGQPAPREISATETNLIAGTTESVYGFISDSVDEYRAAKKRILYESFIGFGEQEFRCPVMNRYPKSVIQAAGFKAEDGEMESAIGDQPPADRYTIVGTKNHLIHDYIFTSRDGAERAVNTQSAQVLTQLLTGLLQNPAIMGALKKEQLYNLVNEIFRLSGAGYDLKLEVEAGEENAPLGPDPSQQMMQQIQQMVEGVTKAVESNKEDLDQLKQAVEPVLKALTMQGAQSVAQGQQQQIPPAPDTAPAQFPAGMAA